MRSGEGTPGTPVTAAGQQARPRGGGAADIVLEGISSGRLGPGARMPAQSALRAQAGCASSTVMRALRYLSDAGFTCPVPGGYRVRSDVAAVLRRLAAASREEGR